MDKPRKKSEEIVPWLSTKVHVWRSKAGDLTVINLREPTESLKAQTVPAAPQAFAPPPKKASPQDSVSALFAKIQSNRRQEKGGAIETTASLTQRAAKAGEGALPPTPPPVQPAARPVVTESHDPVFPKPTPNTANEFEFVSGTNIPGRGVVRGTGVVEEKTPVPEKRGEGTQCLALFHDPLWGDSASTWIPAPEDNNKNESAPKPKPFFDIYGAKNRSTAVSAPPPPVVAPAAAVTAPPPVVSAPSPSPAPTHTHPNTHHRQLHGAPPAVQMAGYPMFGLAAPFVTQTTLAPSMVPMNYQYYQVTGVSPSQTQIAQVVHMPMSAASMHRPGTNVEALPFVPHAGN